MAEDVAEVLADGGRAADTCASPRASWFSDSTISVSRRALSESSPRPPRKDERPSR